MGCQMIKGALLTGPPGVGKTLLAKAIANESNMYFIQVSGSEFVEKYIGLGAQRVRELFQQAQENQPAIIFIDEIDAIAKKRDSFSGHSERDVTLNELLVQMDGFSDTKNIVVLAATNRKDMLDQAILRPGRLDRIIQISLPNKEERKEILDLYLSKIKTINIDLEKLSLITHNFSGADLKNLCNEAAILAVRNNRINCTMDDFIKSLDKIQNGIEKDYQYSDQELEILSCYVTGQILTKKFFGLTNIITANIYPKSKHDFGNVLFEESDKHIQMKDYIDQEIMLKIAGSEFLKFFKNKQLKDSSLQQAYLDIQNDIKKNDYEENIQWEEYQYKKSYSEQTASEIDQKIDNQIKIFKQKLQEIFQQYDQEKIQQLINHLIKNKNIDINSVNQILE